MTEPNIEQLFPDNTADVKRKAQVMYFSGYKIAEIARQLNIPTSTISSWKERERWDDFAPVGRVELTLESRLNLLILKENKSGADYKEIDSLGRQMERMARVKKYSFGDGNETDLNPKLKNRNTGQRRKPEQNAISQEQEELLINGFLGGMFQYQRIWHDAKSNRIRDILKSRQIGATYYFSLEAFIDALTTGYNQIFLSASKKQALQFRTLTKFSGCQNLTLCAKLLPAWRRKKCIVKLIFLRQQPLPTLPMRSFPEKHLTVGGRKRTK